MNKPLIRMKACPSCKERKGEPAFQLAKAAGYGCCDSCLPNAQYAAAEAISQKKRLREFLAALDTNDVPTFKRPPKLSEMLAGLMEEFGGVHLYVHELAEQMREMATQRRGHPDTVRLFQAVLKLVHEDNKRQDIADHLAMTSQERSEAMEAALANYMAETLLDQKKAQTLLGFLQPMIDANDGVADAPPPVLPAAPALLEGGNAEVQL